MLWKNNTDIPELGQRIKYRDRNGIIHHGIFDTLNDCWLVRDVLGGLTNHWWDVVEWQSLEPLLVDVKYQNFLLASIEAELA